MNINIPRIIMQMWDDNNIPFKWITSPTSIKEYIPEWKYIFLTKYIYRKFVIKYFPDYLFYYDSFSFDIQRTNAVCYMWMYKVGGVYMGLNYELTKKLDSLFYNGSYDAYFVPSTNNSKWYINSFIAAKPGCSIFLEFLQVMRNFTPWWCINKQSKILYTSGSGMLSGVLKNTKIPFNIINSYDIPSCSVCEQKCSIFGSYVIRLMDDSWDNWDTYFYNIMYCNFKWIIVLIVTIILGIWLYSLMSQQKTNIKKELKKESEWKIKTELL